MIITNLNPIDPIRESVCRSCTLTPKIKVLAQTNSVFSMCPCRVHGVSVSEMSQTRV